MSAWRVSLEERQLGSSSIIIRMSAIRKPAAEAADNGLLEPELAAGIARVRSAKSVGIRTGNWLSVRQAQSQRARRQHREGRDRAILAVLLGCGLRRSEVAALTLTHVQQRDGRWCIVDLVGKHGRVRTAPTRWGARAWARRWSGRCFGNTRRKLAFQVSRLMTFEGPARSCAEQLAASWSRSNCSWTTLRFRPPNGVWEQSRI